MATTGQEVTMPDEDRWRTIDSAPNDGSWVFVYWRSMSIALYPLVAFWNGEDWDTRERIGLVMPTHWMPLPPPPKDSHNERSEG
jgi:hypothetical protein